MLLTNEDLMTPIHSTRIFETLASTIILTGSFILTSCAGGLGAKDGPPDLSSMSPADRLQMLKNHFMQRVAHSPSGTVTGTVLSVDEAPLSGVTVQIDQQTALTDSSGHYTLTNVPVGPYVVTFQHPSYVLAQRPVTVLPTEAPQVDVSLLARSKAQQLNADIGGSITVGSLTLNFEPNDLAFGDGTPVHGMVDVTMTVIDPRTPRHISAAPARLEGIDVDGNQVGLFSYGMAEIEVAQGAKKLQVRPGQSVTAAMNVTGLGAKVDSIPMWHHDTSLGLWVQESAANALTGKRVANTAFVEEHVDGALVATAELPHFSAWNWDTNNGSSCTSIVIPKAKLANVTGFRTISTDASGNLDNSWELDTPQCKYGTNSVTCATDSPSGTGAFGADAYFKYQAQVNGAWCDLAVTVSSSSTAIIPVVKTVLQGQDIINWEGAYMRPAASGTWCGTPPPSAYMWITGARSLSGYPDPLPLDRVSLIVDSSPCSSLGAFAANLPGDSGFQTMSMNSTGSSPSDIDRDGVNDSIDTCFGNSSAQTDANRNGIGDACESYCYIPLTDPDSFDFDFDQDTIDDVCDDRYTVYNPSQYMPRF